MAAKQRIDIIISARDRTRAVFNRIFRSIRRFRLGFGSLIGGLTFGALARDAVQTATQIEGAAARLGESGDDLEALRTVAGDLNLSFETLAGVIQRLGTNASRAAGGNGELLKAFRELGIATSPAQLSQLSNLELFFGLADAAATKNWNDIADSIARIGDTEAVKLRGLLEQGSPALQQQIDQLIASGQVLGEENRKTAAAAEAQFRREVAEAQRALADAIIALTPVLQAATPILRDAVDAANRVVEAGQRSGGFGLGERAFELAGTPEARRRTLQTAGVVVPPLGVFMSVISQIEANTRNNNNVLE